MMNKIKELFENHGCFVGILAIIVVLAFCFGIMCANAALLMLCWNFAVVAAIPVCAPIDFWVALVLNLAIHFLFGFKVASKLSND